MPMSPAANSAGRGGGGGLRRGGGYTVSKHTHSHKHRKVWGGRSPPLPPSPSPGRLRLRARPHRRRAPTPPPPPHVGLRQAAPIRPCSRRRVPPPVSIPFLPRPHIQVQRSMPRSCAAPSRPRLPGGGGRIQPYLPPGPRHFPVRTRSPAVPPRFGDGAGVAMLRCPQSAELL